MLSAGRKNFYAIGCSVVIHVILIFVINNSAGYVYGSASSEVFETVDYIENVDMSLTKQKQMNNIGEDKQPYICLELMLYSEKQLRQELASVKQIKIPKIENVMKKERKSAIVNAPAVLPKIINSCAVPYPDGCDGCRGTVLTCVLVGIDGKPEYVSIARSSGNPVLDGAAINCCINWQFSPAKDSRGNNVRCLIYIPVGVGT